MDTNGLDLTNQMFQKKKEGESLFLLSLDQSGEKIADEMNPILGMYRMPTPAYYLRGVYPMGDLKCIVKMKSNEMPVSVPTHMDKIIREWIRDGVKEMMFGPPPEEKKSNDSSSSGTYGRKGDAPKDFKETPVWQYQVDDGDKGSSSWENFHEDDQSLIEVAWRDRETSVRISNDGGESFRVELGDGDLEKQEEQFARININTNERIRARRLPGTCIYPNMPQGVRCEVQYVVFERSVRARSARTSLSSFTYSPIKRNNTTQMLRTRTPTQVQRQVVARTLSRLQ